LLDHRWEQRHSVERRTLVPGRGVDIVAGKPDQAVAGAHVCFEYLGLLGGDVGDVLKNHDVKARDVLGRQVDPWHRLHGEVLLTRTVAASPERLLDETTGTA
jgi:hypothetical protein